MRFDKKHCIQDKGVEVGRSLHTCQESWLGLLKQQAARRNRRHITGSVSGILHRCNGAWPLGTSSKSSGQSRRQRSAPEASAAGLVHGRSGAGPYSLDPCRSLGGGLLWHLAHGHSPRPASARDPLPVSRTVAPCGIPPTGRLAPAVLVETQTRLSSCLPAVAPYPGGIGLTLL